jgi:tetratricopeptide (TPR) repeat protein
MDIRRVDLDLLCSDHEPSNDELSYFAAAHTAFGFPVVFQDSVYERLSELMQRYGAAYAESLTGILERPSEEFPLTWPGGIPKLVLHVGDRKAVTGVKPPLPFLAAAWTVVTEPEQETSKFAYWPFALGTDRYMKSIRRAAHIITEAAQRRGFTSAIFEFDSEANWFGDTTPLTPPKILELYRSIEKADWRLMLQQKHAFVSDFQLRTEPYISATQRFYDGVLDDAMLRLQKADLLTAKGVAELRLGHFVAAREQLLEATQINICYPWRWFFLGVCFYQTGDLSRTLDAFREAVEESVDDLLAWSQHGFHDRGNQITWFACLWIWYYQLGSARHQDRQPNEDLLLEVVIGDSPNAGESHARRSTYGGSDAWFYDHWYLVEEVIRFSQDARDAWRVEHRAITAILEWWKELFGEAIRLPFQEELESISLDRPTESRTGHKSEPEETKTILTEFTRKLKSGAKPALKMTFPRLSTDTLRSIIHADEAECIAYLSSPKWRQRQAAEFRLVVAGRTNELCDRYQDASSETRRLLARTLGVIAEERPHESEKIGTFLSAAIDRESSPKVLKELLWACGRTGCHNVVRTLGGFLEGEQWGVADELRQVALRAILALRARMDGEVNADASTSDLARLFSGIMHKWPHDDVTESLLEGLKSKISVTRQICTMLLGVLGDRHCLEPLLELQRKDTGSSPWGRNSDSAAEAIASIEARADSKTIEDHPSES